MTDRQNPADGATPTPSDANETLALGSETLAYPSLGHGNPQSSLGADAVVLVEKWLRLAANSPVDPAAERLAGVLRDKNGLAFTVGFVDGVMRPEDPMVAGHNLHDISKLTPGFLPWYLQTAIRLGGMLGPVVPWVVIPIARRVLRKMVGHLVLDASDEKLTAGIAKLRAGGNRLNLNLLGEAVLGEDEADRRLAGTYSFLARDDVDYVSIKVSSVASQLSMWAFDDAVERVVDKLTPLYQLAASSSSPKFINLDMEEYRDLDLTIAVFKRLLDKPELRLLEAGIVLQAYLPDALGALQELTAWATERRAAGGAPIKVRVVKGANLALERVDAAMHGWPLATVASKQDADTNYKRVLDWALTLERTDAVKIGVAGHNLFDIAFAWLLAGERGVREAVDIEMLLGMATGQAAAVSADVGQLLLYTPVVDPKEFDVAIAYLIRRLEENASQENFMSAVFELSSNRELFERERDRFLGSLAALDPEVATPQPARVQNRARQREELLKRLTEPPALPTTTTPASEDEGLTSVVLGFSRGSLTSAHTGIIGGPGSTPGFRNSPDTDPSIAANRQWAGELLQRAHKSKLGVKTVRAAAIKSSSALNAVIERALAAQIEWGAKSADERAALLHKAGEALEARRAELLEVMAAEAGKTLAEGDPEVSEAVDFAHYYAERSRELDLVQGARFVPSKLTVVTPPWNFPVAIPAGGVLAALAAGSAAIIKPAKLAQRSGAVMVEALWEAGISRDLLALVDVSDRELGKALIGDRRVDRVILTGSYETAKLFRSFRPELSLLAETSGKNAIIVTPSADLDLAAADVVRSAFGHAGQKCSAASLVILVGSVGASERFERQLLDAARSLRVGYPIEPSSQMGPIIAPAEGKLLNALTTLGEGETWLLEPKQLDATGRLWSPGIRTGVQAGSEFHLTEYFGPVLGVMKASSLKQAIEWQNAVEYGLTAGLHALDPMDVTEWLDQVQAGNLYVNRGITGAIVQRQPFGGWKRSSVGAGAKAGGPNYLFGLGSWEPAPLPKSETLHLKGLDRRVTEVITSAQSRLSFEQFDHVRQACLSDQIAWQAEYAQTVDHSGLRVERNLLRYRPVPTAIRLADDCSLVDALRVICAALLSRAPLTVSTGIELPAGVRIVLAAREANPRIESDGAWLDRIAALGSAALANDNPSHIPERLRIASSGSGGQLAARLAHTLPEAVDLAVWSHPVTGSGRVELLPFLQEQSISITAHRFGNPNPAMTDLAL